MKTPEEMAEEYADSRLSGNETYEYGMRQGFLAGYQAAKDTYKDAISAYEDVAKQMLEEAVRIMSPKDQLQPHPFHAGADVYIIDANNPMPKPMPLSIAEQDQLADADKVMCNTTMEEIKAADTGELMPITNLPTSAKWISVKERLPESWVHVLIYQFPTTWVSGYCHERKRWGYYESGEPCHPTHWMPLPEAPKGEG